MDKSLDIKIYKTVTGFTIQSDGYHKALPEGNILPCDANANSEDDLYKKLASLVRAHLVTQKSLNERGYQGFREMFDSYKPLDKNLTLS